MDSKHESAINVLRGEQGRRMRMREQRQEKELANLQKVQKKEGSDLAKGCDTEKEKFGIFEDDRRRRLVARWQVQNAILVKRFEAESGVAAKGSLPIPDWGIGIGVEKKLENMHVGNGMLRRSRWDSLIAE